MLCVYVWGLGGGEAWTLLCSPSIQQLNSTYIDLFPGTHFPEPTVLNTCTLISHFHSTSLMFSVFFPLHVIPAKRRRKGSLEKTKNEYFQTSRFIKSEDKYMVRYQYKCHNTLIISMQQIDKLSLRS